MAATWEIINDKAGWGRVARGALVKASLICSDSNVLEIPDEEEEYLQIESRKQTLDTTSDDERLTRRKIVAELERCLEDDFRLEADSLRAAWIERSQCVPIEHYLDSSYSPHLDYAAASSAAAAAAAQVAAEVQLQLRHTASEKAFRAAEAAVVKAEATVLQEYVETIKKSTSDPDLLKIANACLAKVETAFNVGNQKELEIAKTEVEALAEAVAAASAVQASEYSVVPEEVPEEDLLLTTEEEVVIEDDQNTTEVSETVQEVKCSEVDRVEERKQCINYLAKYLAEKEAAVEEIASGTRWKTVRRDCQRAVNLAVNAISATSSAHLADKLARLSDLLDGRSVPLAGGETFCSCTAHPRAIDFCTIILAKKVVKVGEDVVSSHPDTAFAVAAVTARLAGRFPRLAALLQAQFHRTCCLLIPSSSPSGDMTPGVREDEDHDKWLKRISGAARMMGAVLVSRTGSSKSPLGVAEAWAWLASFLAIDPLPDISATLLLDVLEVTGHRLLSHYGYAFQKLLYLVCTDYVPQVEAVTLPGRGGPVQRLKTFLEDVIRDQCIPPPKGLLPKDFW